MNLIDRQFKVDMFIYENPITEMPLKYNQGDEGSCSIDISLYKDSSMEEVVLAPGTSGTAAFYNSKNECIDVVKLNVIGSKISCVFSNEIVSNAGKNKIVFKVIKDNEVLTLGILKYSMQKDLEIKDVSTMTNYQVLVDLISDVSMIKTEIENKLANGDFIGEVGPQGPQGIQGPQGAQGIQGLKGDRGESGERGPQGIQGNIGPQGERGATGERGPQGEAGDITEFKKDYDSLKKVIIDENQAANLQDQINQTNSSLDDKISFSKDTISGVDIPENNVTHTHPNKVELDKIQIGDKEKWDSKSNFSGKYNDLTNIPNDLATESYVKDKIEEASLNCGEVDLSGLATKEELNQKVDKVQDSVDELFQSVSNGKQTIASAITDMGIPTNSTDSFVLMAENIRKIKGNEPEHPLGQEYANSITSEYIMDKIYPMGQPHEAIPSGEYNDPSWKYNSKWENQHRPISSSHDCSDLSWGQCNDSGVTKKMGALGCWSNVYRVEGTSFTQNTGVEMKDIKVYGWDGSKWCLEQHLPVPNGNFYPESFGGDINKHFGDSVKQTYTSKTVILREKNKIEAMDWNTMQPREENCMYHPFSDIKLFSEKYQYIYTCVDLRKVKWDENGVDDRDSTHYCSNCGGDWWRAEGLAWDDSWQHNNGVGQMKFIEITNNWRRFSMSTVPQEWINGFPN